MVTVEAGSVEFEHPTNITDMITIKMENISPRILINISPSFHKGGLKLIRSILMP